MSRRSGYDFREADDHFEAQAAKDAYVNASGVLKTVATSLFKIVNDLRWLSSGPRNGIGEIDLPSLQPGSSIMPGKVNPVIHEAVMMIAAPARRRARSAGSRSRASSPPAAWARCTSRCRTSRVALSR